MDVCGHVVMGRWTCVRSIRFLGGAGTGGGTLAQAHTFVSDDGVLLNRVCKSSGVGRLSCALAAGYPQLHLLFIPNSPGCAVLHSSPVAAPITSSAHQPPVAASSSRVTLPCGAQPTPISCCTGCKAHRQSPLLAPGLIQL